MQLAAPKFEPRHAAHAIEQFAVTVGFLGAIKDESLRKLIAASEEFGAELPGKGPHETTVSFAISPSGDVQVGPVARPGRLPGWMRQRLRPDGAIEAQLRMARNELTYVTDAYTRWNDLFPKIKFLFSKVLPIYCQELKTRSISLQYMDKFIWNGNVADVKASKLIRQPCKYIPEFIFGLTDNFHCHVGAFTKPSPDTKRLFNLNVDAVDEASVPGETRRVINTFILLTDNFQQTGYEPLSVTSENCMQIFETHASTLHTESKAILGEILTDEMTERIQLRAP